MEYDAAAVAEVELDFREGIWCAAPADAVDEQEIGRRRFGPILATVFAALPGARTLNMVLGAAESGAVSRGHLAGAVEWMRSWEVDYRVSVAADRPDTARAEAWLEGHGFEPHSAVRRYARLASQPAHRNGAAVEVRRLAPEQMEEMTFICAETFGLSDLATIMLIGLPALHGWRCYAAYLDGGEVACAAMMVAGDIAMLGLDATRPVARRRGCQSALIHRRLVEAAETRCRVVLAEVCDDQLGNVPATSNLRRAGFVEVGRCTNWGRPEAPGAR